MQVAAVTPDKTRAFPTSVQQPSRSCFSLLARDPVGLLLAVPPVLLRRLGCGTEVATMFQQGVRRELPIGPRPLEGVSVTAEYKQQVRPVPAAAKLQRTIRRRPCQADARRSARPRAALVPSRAAAGWFPFRSTAVVVVAGERRPRWEPALTSAGPLRAYSSRAWGSAGPAESRAPPAISRQSASAAAPAMCR